jgi:hypothetical protein
VESGKTNNKGKSPKKATTKLKANQRNALEQFGDRLHLLVAIQKNAVERTEFSDDPTQVQMTRLAIYDRFMPLLVTCFESLDDTLSPKHPGGAPRNEFRPLAFDLLTDHYIEHGEILQAKKLVRAVTAKLPEGTLDADASGKELFSSRVAGEVIKEFKACLHSHPDDWN